MKAEYGPMNSQLIQNFVLTATILLKAIISCQGNQMGIQHQGQQS